MYNTQDKAYYQQQCKQSQHRQAQKLMQHLWIRSKSMNYSPFRHYTAIMVNDALK